ncbi:MAG: uroporphyrinogen-III synthase [Isosphaeraceae bacterium]
MKDELSRVATVEQVAVYTNADAADLPESVKERLAEGSVDWVTLTSSAITERLHGLLPPEREAVWVDRYVLPASAR